MPLYVAFGSALSAAVHEVACMNAIILTTHDMMTDDSR